MPIRSFNVDTGNSAIEFAAVYATNSIIKGRFNAFSGTIDLDEEAPASSRFEIEIAAGSVDTNNAGRDERLRGADFFDAESFATLRFVSNSVEVLDDRHWKVTGDLTIRDRSHALTLDTRYYGVVTDPAGNVRAGLVAEGELSRSTWGLDWNVELSGGGMLFSDAVRVNVYISAVAPREAGPGEEREEQAADGGPG